jgi:Tfp pilus assembly protein PilW
MTRTTARRAELDEHGTSLIELLFALALLTIVVVAFGSSFLSVQKSDAYVQGRSQSLDEMRVTINRMTRDLRQGASFVGQPTASDVTVRTYVNGVARDVRYQVSGSDLLRSVGGGTPVALQHGVVTPDIFTFAPDTTNPQVVTITLQVEPSNAPDTTVTLESEVRLRNLTEAE